MGELHIEEIGLHLVERNEGLEVRQFGDAYLAKGWNLSSNVVSIVELAARHDLIAMLQHGHPQASKRFPAGDGAEYLSFARSAATYWVFALDDRSGSTRTNRSDVVWVLFNKAYRHALAAAGVHFDIEPFRSASNIRVALADAPVAIAACLPWIDELSRRGGRRGAPGAFLGFRDESDIERWLMENLLVVDLGRKVEILGRQRAFDAGTVDILLRDLEGGGLIVMEIKQGRTQRAHADQQLRSYLGSHDLKRLAGGKPVLGCLVAESVDKPLRDHIRLNHHDVVAFEIRWRPPGDVDLTRVAGEWPD